MKYLFTDRAFDLQIILIVRLENHPNWRTLDRQIAHLLLARLRLAVKVLVLIVIIIQVAVQSFWKRLEKKFLARSHQIFFVPRLLKLVVLEWKKRSKIMEDFPIQQKIVKG